MQAVLTIAPPDRGKHRSVVVEAADDDDVGRLADALAAHLGVPTGTCALLDEVRSVVLPRSSSVGSAGLVNGGSYRLVLAQQVAGALPVPHLVVLQGPAAGRRWPLTEGARVVGRSVEADIVLDDPEVSRRHATLTCIGGRASIQDTQSLNGTLVGEQPTTEPVALEPGVTVRLGNTVLSVLRPDRLPPPDGGRVPFNRPPRVVARYEPPKVVLPEPPGAPGKQRLPFIAALLPLLMGAVLYAFTDSVLSLVMAAMSPLMVIGSAVEARRHGKGGQKAALAAWRKRLAATSDELDDVVRRARSHRLDEAPAVSALVARAHTLAPELWERTATDDDFLSLRPGIADLPGRVVPELPTNGQEELLAELRALRDEHALDRDVPVPLELGRHGHAGVVGPVEAVDAMARSLLAQAITLHGPRDLAVVALLSPARVPAFQWLRWAPHTESLVTGAGARSVASTPDDVPVLFAALKDVISTRKQRPRPEHGQRSPHLPHVLVVLDDEVPLDRPELDALLAEAAAHGVSSLYLARSRDRLPVQSRIVLEVGASTASMLVVPTGASTVDITPEPLDVPTATAVAHALAGLADVSAGRRGGSLPPVVSLLEVLDLPAPTPETVAARWAGSRGGLGAPIGIGATGPVSLDVRGDGPHALVAGTTGAGKSELLQTFVASLAATHPPTRLTFVLVDYKGGAAFKDCVALPHVVGFFTDLDPGLAARALTSLNAELKHREHVLGEHGCKDVAELETKAPQVLLPSLVIVFDEFAFLKKELPDFISGIVDIAQRGRSLGVHLVLATQIPAGVVDENIKGNANLRLSLRVQTEAESNDVIRSPLAARLPERPRGRAYVRSGGSEPQLVQVAWSGHVAGAARPPVAVGDFGFGPTSTLVQPEAAAAGATDLHRLVDACTGAARGLPAPRPPWLPALPESLSLEELAQPSEGLVAVIGRLDEPEMQRQPPHAVDLERDGHLLVYGTGGAGKTTVLRTLALALAGRSSTDQLWVYGLDFASRGLRCLEDLPHCGGVFTGDEPERVERLFTVLEGLVSQRRVELGSSGAASAADLRRRGGTMPAVLVLLDGYAGFAAAFEDVDHGALLTRLQALVTDGRAVGIHLVVTADRRGVVPAPLASQISSRLVLRLADADDYVWLGLPSSTKNLELGAGRALTLSAHLVQVAESGADLTTAVAKARAAAPAGALRPLAVQLLPERLPLSDLPVAAGSLALPFGIEGVGMGPAHAALDDISGFLVCGPDRSGRSTALEVLVRQYDHAVPGAPRYLLAPRRSPLLALPGWTGSARGQDACDDLAADLLALVQQRTDESPLLVVVDDADELHDSRGGTSLELMVRKGRDTGLVVVASSQASAAFKQFSGVVKELKQAKHGLLLAPEVEIDGEVFGVKLPRRVPLQWPSGRGFLVRRGRCVPVQVADPG